MKKRIAMFIMLALLGGLIFFLLNLGQAEDPAREIGLIHLERQDMPSNVQDYLEQYMMSENYKAFSYDDQVYLFAAKGEQSQQGHSIVLKDPIYKKGILTVTVEKREPEDDENGDRELNYPYKLVKMADNTVEYKKVIFKDPSARILAEEEIELIEIKAESLLTLYFGTEDGYFRKETRLVDGQIGPENASIIIEELIKGPSQADSFRVLPEGTELISYAYDAGEKLVTLDLGGKIREVRGSAGEIFAVYSLVNSLAEIDGIEKVQILIEGQVVESLAGHIYLGDPLSPDYSFLEDNKYK